MFVYAAWIFSFSRAFRVSASAANFEIPSRSFSTAMASSFRSNRKSDSLFRYERLGMSRDAAPAGSSFLGTASVEL